MEGRLMEKPIVVKFGGSSLANSEQFKKVKKIIESDDRAIMYQMFDNRKTPLFGMDLYQDNKGFSLK